jgi:hypothetical protein
MADKQRYRHAITGLVGEFERELAEVFKGVLIPVVEGVVPAPSPTPDPEPDAAEGNSNSEEKK